MPEFLMHFLHAVGLIKMTATELILFRGDHVRHYVDPEPNSLIYHYTNISGAEGILNSQRIWLSGFEKKPTTHPSSVLQKHGSRK